MKNILLKASAFGGSITEPRSHISVHCEDSHLIATVITEDSGLSQSTTIKFNEDLSRTLLKKFEKDWISEDLGSPEDALAAACLDGEAYSGDLTIDGCTKKFGYVPANTEVTAFTASFLQALVKGQKSAILMLGEFVRN